MDKDDFKTIALFGLFGCSNLGNEATLAATYIALQRRMPDANWVLISDPPASEAGLPLFPDQMDHDVLPVASYLGKLPYRMRGRRGFAALHLMTEPLRARRTRQLGGRIDLLLIAGTGIADDFCQGPYETPHNIRRWSLAVAGQGGRVRFASIGAGPVASPLSVRWFRQAMEPADYRSYRENSSYRFASEIGLDTTADQVLPDMVFSLPVAEYHAQRQLQWPPRVIGLGVMAYFGWNADAESGQKIYVNYIAKMAMLADALTERGYIVRFLCGARGDDPRAVQDVIASMKHKEALERHLLIASNIVTYRDVLSEIVQTDLVIATRFHTALKALLLERPVISVAYAKKNNDLMAEMGLARFCHTAETFNVGQVLDQVDQLAKIPPPLATLRDKLVEYRAQLDRQFDEVIRP